jgi:hypothetical protein
LVRTRSDIALQCVLISALLLGCDGRVATQGDLVINELMSNNEGAAIDEYGESDDWIELYNRSDDSTNLSNYTLSDGGDEPVPLPAVELGAGARIVLWADNKPEQGALHLPFKLSSGGGDLQLEHGELGVTDTVDFPDLTENESFARFEDARGAFAACRYASPGRSNGASCEPPTRPNPADSITYASYEWPSPWPSLPGPLTLSELALNPAQYIEVLNISEQTVDLDDYTITLADHAPGLPWPRVDQGTQLTWGSHTRLRPGERVQVPVSAQDIATIAASPSFEGVATLFEAASATAVERVDFMHWPADVVLARDDDRGPHRLCTTSTPGEANTECQPLAEREVGNRLRDLRTPHDFTALAQGGTEVGIESVKFVVDLAAGNVVHFVSSADYAFHYTFIREAIDREPKLDLCDPAQSAQFFEGWVTFSQQEYFQTQGRRYLMGTLNHHLGQGLHTIDFTEGDAITPQQMQHAFFTVLSHVSDPTIWVMHPRNDEQIVRMQQFNGQAPIVGLNAPYRDITLQALTPGVAFGQLRFVPAAELDRVALGPDVIVVTDDVPNDIPFVGGLITEAFQTPLAHVNVLSRSRNTPNMALNAARTDPRIADHLNQLVRFEVTSSGFTIEPADLAEAQQFWALRTPMGPRLAPRQDLSVSELQSLADHGFDSIPVIGAKAAQLAELQKAFQQRLGSNAPLPMPEHGFAVPLLHYVEHFEHSGARDLLHSSADALRDPTARPAALAAIRARIESYPIDPQLVRALRSRIQRDFGEERVRFRSSSNTEDLSEFNGAGLYTSTSVELDDADRSIESALHTVWSSLWNNRAYDEREYANIDHSQSAMGVLVHEAFLSEQANGVAITRDIFNPIRADQFYINAQRGEAAVTNPAPGVTSEEFVVRWTWPDHPITYSSRSSLIPGMVMTKPEIDLLIEYLRLINDHFRPLVDPEEANRWFAMDIEFKLIGPERRLIVKQARPYSFGRPVIPDDCREF